MKKRIISVLLAMVMLISCLPASVFAAKDTDSFTNPTVFVKDAIGAAGSTVKVDVKIANNPGVAGAKITLSYHEDLTLVGAASGSAFSLLDYTKPGMFTSPCNFTWDSENTEATADGIILTLTFQISEDAAANDKLGVNLSYRYGDFYDSDLDSVAFDMVSGYVQVLDYIPGDVNSDGVVNGKDVTLARRINAGGYSITGRIEAANVNGDTIINGKDITLIRRYNAGGYDVELLPSPPLCSHEMQAVEAKAPTCQVQGNNAYWYCDLCKNCFTDPDGYTQIQKEDTVLEATGHTLVTIPGKAPDYGIPGLSDGVVCSVPGCGHVEVKQEELPPLQPNECFVEYNLGGADEYLKQYLLTADIEKINLNPSVFDTTHTEHGLLPIDLNAIPGYEFQGWVNGYGDPVREIAQGTTGTVTLIATWKKTSYNVVFDSPLMPKDKLVRTIDEVFYLPQNMEWDHYIFMGWSDASGRIIDAIKPGTKDITVHANWTSNRNLAKANNYQEDGPIIIEDEAEKKYYFVYDLGMILNVPLETIHDLGYRSSLSIEETVTKKVLLEKSEATTINTAVENATTNSSSWTLSKDWNELLTNTTGGETEVASNQTIALSTGTSKAYGSSGSTYVGESFHASEDNLTTAKTVTDDSYKIGVEAGIEAGYGPMKASVSTSAETAHSEHQEDYSEKQTSMSMDSTWNTTNSYNSSSSFNQQSSVSNSIMEMARDTWQHEISKSMGGSDSQTTQDSVSNKVNEGYSSSMMFHSVEEEVTVQKISSGADTVPGYYRYVLAGDYYVYAIVCYDVATASYSVHTYSILADETRKFLDYSKNDPKYEDYNNAVLPFEVPIDVHNYIFDSLSVTDGLIIDKETGIVTGYEGTAKKVCVPDYAIFNNDDGGIPDVVKVTAIASNVFTGKSIEMVKLGRYITRIPKDAFKNCSELKTVKYETLTHIGDNAFSGCTSLQSFVVENTVTELGENAFDGVVNVTVNANKAAVAVNAISSAANILTLNLNYMTDTLSNAELDVKATESFTINGFGKTYNGVNIISGANTTVINRMTLSGSTHIPLKLNSANVTLNQVKIENTKLMGVVLEATATVLTLQGKVSVSTSGQNAIMTKNLTVLRKPGVLDATELNVNDKDVLICGTLTDEKAYLKVLSAEQIKYITDTEFSNKLSSRTVFFDAAGGTVGESSRVCAYGETIGTLPVPFKDYCNFIGWCTDINGGGQRITAETVITEDMTLYAHWDLKPVSGWVRKSDMPADAQVVNTKWTYDKTTNTRSSEPYIEGWSLYHTEWKWSDYGAWSNWSTAATSNSEFRQVETQTVTDKAGYTQYHYYIWVSSDHKWIGSEGFQGVCWYYEEIFLDYQLELVDAVNGLYGYAKCANASYHDRWFQGASKWISAVTHTEYRYRDRSKIYTYYHTKTDHLESATPVSASDSISNVVEWVQYREK